MCIDTIIVQQQIRSAKVFSWSFCMRWYKNYICFSQFPRKCFKKIQFKKINLKYTSIHYITLIDIFDPSKLHTILPVSKPKNNFFFAFIPMTITFLFFQFNDRTRGLFLWYLFQHFQQFFRNLLRDSHVLSRLRFPTHLNLPTYIIGH